MSDNKIFSQLLHGADYNYEQWLDYPEVLDEDFRLMKQAGCNVMTVGVFSWAKLEPREGQYDFSWLDVLMHRLHAAGMGAILATPSGAKPAWLSHTYPEVCRVGSDGKREAHGFRHNHCRTSPVYREKVLAINTLLAERYRDHPALKLWHVSNEYNSGPCYCELCLEAFRQWLKKRYGSLDALNKAWWTTFWSHSYSDWGQIAPGDTSIHGLQLDWMRFISDQTLDFFLAESEPLRRITPKVPITTNFMLPDVGLDYGAFAPHVSVISWDSYPRWHVEAQEWKEGMRAGFFHDLFRSMKHRSFMLMESSPNVTNWQGVSIPKRENMHLLSSLQAVAHGSDTVQYFQWRQSRGGEEKFHGAVIGHNGRSDTKVFNDVAQVGRALAALSEVNGAQIDAEVAIIYDVQSEWALNIAQLPLNTEKRYQERCIAHYQALWHMGVSVDIIDSTSHDLSAYALVIAPMLYMLRPKAAEMLKSFVAQGGTLVTTYVSGLVDQSDLVFPGGAPGPLRELLGLWVEDTDISVDREPGRIGIGENEAPVMESANQYSWTHYGDQVRLEGARVMGRYLDGPLDGYPALTVNSYGNGRAWYIASRNDDRFYAEFYSRRVSELGIQARIAAPFQQGVSVQARQGNGVEYRFYMNFNGDWARLPGISDDEFAILGSDSLADGKLPPYGLYITKRMLL